MLATQGYGYPSVAPNYWATLESKYGALTRADWTRIISEEATHSEAEPVSVKRTYRRHSGFHRRNTRVNSALAPKAMASGYDASSVSESCFVEPSFSAADSTEYQVQPQKGDQSSESASAYAAYTETETDTVDPKKPTKNNKIADADAYTETDDNAGEAYTESQSQPKSFAIKTQKVKKTTPLAGSRRASKPATTRPPMRDIQSSVVTDQDDTVATTEPSVAKSQTQDSDAEDACGCPVTVTPLQWHGAEYTFQRPRDKNGRPVVCSAQRSSVFTWTVPKGVHSISVTACGGGGAGGARVQTFGTPEAPVPTIMNGTGGQAGASFVDYAIDVCPGDEVTFTVGAGGNPPSAELYPILTSEDPVEGEPAAPAYSIYNRDYCGVQEAGCTQANQQRLLFLASGSRGVVNDTTGHSTTVSIRDCAGRWRTPLLASGGLSGQQVTSILYQTTRQLSPFPGLSGLPSRGSGVGEVTSSATGAGVPPPAGFPPSDNLPGQGAASAFSAGGVSMLMPFNYLDTVGALNQTPLLPANGMATTHGTRGSGGAGATARFRAGRGGDGFIKFQYTQAQAHAQDQS